MHTHIKPIIAIIITITLLTATLLANTYIQTQNQKTLHLNIVLGGDRGHVAGNGLTAYLKLSASYDIKVYRHGKLVAERSKDNDPISINWYKLVANFLLLGTNSGQLFSWYDTGYNTHTSINTEFTYTYDDHAYIYNPVMYIALGNGTGTPSLNDYKLFNQVMSEEAVMTVQDDAVNQRFIITYTKTFLIKQQFTLTEVGLILNVNVGGSTHANVLFCHDLVQPSVQLYPNDAVSITYRVEIPYNNAGVFTEWFYNALIDYMLGYKGTTGNSLTLKFASGNTGSIDSGTDYSYHVTATVPAYYTDTKDSIEDYIHINLGTGQSTANPLWQVYSLASGVASVSITDTAHFTTIKDTNGNLTITYIAVHTFASAENISEIGLFLHTDRDGSINTAPDSLLLAYWVLPNPVQVEAYSGLRVEITVTIPYS